MSLQLDTRQRAMLAQMGVRVFGPLPAAAAFEEPGEAAVLAARPAQGQVPAVPAKAPAAPSEHGVSRADARARSGPVQVTLHSGLERMGWGELGAAVSECRACAQCAGRSKPLLGSGDTAPDWLIVGDPPNEDDERSGGPFAGEPGLLLDNMLKALGLDRRNKVYLTSIMKCRPPGGRNPTPEEIAQCEPILRRQIQLLQPKVIVAMGRFSVPTLVGSGEPIGRLRGRIHRYADVPLVVTWHPAYLLRNHLADKAGVWADLCLARQQLL